MVARLILATALSLAIVLPAGAATTAKPALRVVHDLPLTVSGTGFRAQEHITVTVRIGAYRSSSHLQASAVGHFTLRLRGVRLNHCARPLYIVAVGARSGPVDAAIPLTECAAQ